MEALPNDKAFSCELFIQTWNKMNKPVFSITQQQVSNVYI